MSLQSERQMVMLELLHEFDEICRKNNLKYSLSGAFARKVTEGVLPDVFDYIAVAMTGGDINRFIKIIEESNPDGRYVEYALNNSNAKTLDGGFRYGNSNTTLINASTFGSNNHYGIFIYLIEIRKNLKKPSTIKNLERLRNSSKSEPQQYSGVKKIISRTARTIITDKSEERIRKKVYDYYSNVRAVDKWDDIIHAESVIVSNHLFEKERLQKDVWDIKDYEVDGHVYMCSPIISAYRIGNRSVHSAVLDLEISDASRPYSEYLDEDFINHLLKAQEYRDKRNITIRKGREATRTMRNAWRTYLMSVEALQFRNDFADASSDGDAEKVKEVVRDYESRKKYWTSAKIGFVETEEIEKAMKEGEILK